MNKNEKGFGLVELLLLLVVCALIGFVGFYVVSARNKANKTLSTSSKAAAVQELKPFPIPELGVKLMLSSALAMNEAMYQVAPDGQSVGVSTRLFEGTVAECLPSSTAASSFPAIIVLSKHQGAYDKSKAFAELGAYGSFGKQFPDFYISYSTPDGGYCLGSKSDAANKVKVLFNSTRQQLINGVSKAQLIQ